MSPSEGEEIGFAEHHDQRLTVDSYRLYQDFMSSFLQQRASGLAWYSNCMMISATPIISLTESSSPIARKWQLYLYDQRHEMIAEVVFSPAGHEQSTITLRKEDKAAVEELTGKLSSQERPTFLFDKIAHPAEIRHLGRQCNRALANKTQVILVSQEAVGHPSLATPPTQQTAILKTAKSSCATSGYLIMCGETYSIGSDPARKQCLLSLLPPSPTTRETQALMAIKKGQDFLPFPSVHPGDPLSLEVAKKYVQAFRPQSLAHAQLVKLSRVIEFGYELTQS